MAERKVRPIYEALDARNYKQSLKLCTAVLQKPGPANVQLIKALKAVTLQRMGRLEEALEVCREVSGGLPHPTEELVLSTLMIVFKAAGRLGEGTACYDAAYQAEPSNVELASSLFFLLVRGEEYGRAQQVAMRMYKQFGDQYMPWVVCCLVFQADMECLPIDPWHRPVAWSAGAPPKPRPGMAASKTLQLAGAMVGKMESKMTEESHLLLQLSILQRQGQASGSSSPSCSEHEKRAQATTFV